MKKKKSVIDPVRPQALSSLGERLREHGVPVADREAVAAAAPPVQPTGEPGAPDLSRAGKVVVRCERKGHGGKIVTVVDGLALAPAGLDAVARLMRKALGCGSWAEGGRVLLQGDAAAAADAWLRRHGVVRIVRGT